MKQVVLVLSEQAAKVLARHINDTDGNNVIVLDIEQEIQAQLRAQEEDKPKKKGAKRRGK